MKLEGDQVILEKEMVSDWLCYELEQVRDNRDDEIRLSYHQDMIEGALGLLELPPELFRKILVLDPTNENLFRAYQAVIREFGESNFNFLGKLGDQND